MTGYLVDTSLWVEFLRGRGTVAGQRLRHHVERQGARDLHGCEPIVMELLGGAGPGELARVQRLVESLPTIGCDPHLDFRVAGELYRAARATGHTVRSFVDCLIAAIAIRTDSTLVHRDRDFELLAEVSTLRQERWG